MPTPEIRISRPRTSPASFRSSASAGRRRKKSSNKADNGNEEDYQTELLEYEWPDLPPIPCLKDAITRKHVSAGIHYILPVDKGNNSINHNFRTDLRAMFQEPYASDTLDYDDRKVTISAKVHFQPNTADTKWTKEHVDAIPVTINSESESAQKLYLRSTPVDAVRHGVGIDPSKLRKRSNLFLPIKARAHPEAIKLRQEVEKIIKSVQEDNEDEETFEDAQRNENEAVQNQNVRVKDSLPKRPHTTDTNNLKPRSISFRRKTKSDLQHNSTGEGIVQKPPRLKLTATDFSSYDELKRAKPPKPKIPDMFKSSHLDDAKNQGIWEWLHYGEGMTDFQFFLSVCG